jgi:hypothetical protein
VMTARRSRLQADGQAENSKHKQMFRPICNQTWQLR